jgi:hypothetical protein
VIYLLAAGAPRRYAMINIAALAIGVAFATIARRIARQRLPIGSDAPAGATTGAMTGTTTQATTTGVTPGAITLSVGLTLLAIAIFGTPVSGASRWMRVAGLSLQPSLIFLPMAMVSFARNRNVVASIGLAISGVALGLQPDRAMAGTLLAGLVALWCVRREGLVALPIVTAAAGFAATLWSADVVPPAPFVEQVFQSSFAFHPLTGLAVTAGLALLLLPAAVGLLDAGQRREADRHSRHDVRRDAYLVFAVTWLAIIVAALVGDYPTPLVGYGSSTILGYFLSVGQFRGRLLHASG